MSFARTVSLYTFALALAGCSVTTTADDDKKDDTDKATGGGGGGGDKADETGDSGASGPQGFRPTGLLFSAELAFDDAGALADYAIQGNTVPSIFAVEVYDERQNSCQWIYSLTAGQNVEDLSDTAGTGPAAKIKTWADNNTQATAAYVTSGGYEKLGPFDANGQACDIDPEWLGDATVDALFEEWLNDSNGNPVGYYVGVGGVVSATTKTEFVDQVAGQNGFPAANQFGGGLLQLPFNVRDQSGAETNKMDAAVVRFEVSATMEVAQQPAVLDASVNAAGNPMERGLYRVFPIYVLTFAQ